MLSFFRKLSISDKVKDGVLPYGVMANPDDILKSKNQNSLMLAQNETELRETIYGML